MTDSWTQSDIDRCYGRITQQIDLSKIKNKREFSKAIRDNPTTRKWSEKLNDFFWDIHTSKQELETEIPKLVIPARPRELLSSIEKRRQTLESKKNIIRVRASVKQRAYVRNKGRIWIDPEIKFANKLRKDGLNYKQIGIQLGRSKSSISTKLLRVKRR